MQEYYKRFITVFHKIENCMNAEYDVKSKVIIKYIIDHDY